MRILHVDSAATWRGGQNQVLLTARGMARLGHDVALACQSLPGTAAVTLVGLGAAGPTALVAAALCPRVTRLLADDLGPDYSEQPNRTPLAPELLRFGGLSAFTRQLAGRCELRLGGAGRPPLSADELDRELSRIR